MMAEVRTINVSNAVDLALINNPQIKQMAEDVNVAKAQLNESFADLALPKVSLSAGFTLLDPQTVESNVINPLEEFPSSMLSLFHLGSISFPTYTNVYMDNYSAGLSVNKTLFSGFKYLNSWRLKQINLDITQKKFEDKKREVVSGTLSSFYNLFLLRENISLSEQQNITLSNQQRNVEMNYVNGTATEYDKIRVQVLNTYNRPRLLSVQNAYRTAKMAFCDSLGIKDYDQVEFVGNLLDSTNLTMENEDENTLIAQAISNDINLKALDYTIETMKITREINDGTKYPSLAAFFNFKDDYTKDSILDVDRRWITSWTTGLQLNIPVDDWLPVSRTANMVSETEANIRKSVDMRDQMRDSIALQVRSLLMQLEVSKVNISSQMEGMSQAKLGLDVANKRYNAGATPASEIIDSEFSYTQAQAAYLQAIYDYYSSVLKLKRMIGE
jgi:outer membrane protein TolC